MKRTFTSLFFALGALTLVAQTQRTVLLEHFTQASCGPCAVQNPALNATLNTNAGKIVAIKYQVSWPGYDPMNEHNPGQVRSRVDYYDVSGVPSSVLDGGGAAPPSTVNTGSINTHYQTPAPFQLVLTHQISSNLQEVHVQMEITAMQDMDENLVAHLAVIEKEIKFAAPPGSNGEKEFKNVMKQLLPSAAGTSLPKTWFAGQVETVTATWKMENVYDLRQIAVVGFVQNPGTKVVHQATISEPNLSPAGPDDALLSNASGTGDFGIDKICQNTTAPIVELLNAGSSPLTSATIRYRINGAAEQSYNWTGNLTYLQKTSVILPDYDFSILPTNTLEAWVSDPNGNSDVQPGNDYIQSTFAQSPQTTPVSKIEAKPATSPGAFTWEFRDDADNLVVSGGPYTAPLRSNYEDLNLSPNACFSIILKNTSTGFNGFVRITDEQNNQVIRVDASGRGEWKVDVGTWEVSSLHEISTIENLLLFPNPASQSVTIQFDNLEAADFEIQIVDLMGRINAQQSLHFGIGENSFLQDLSGFSPGLYFVKMNSNKGQIIQTLVVE